MCLIILPLKMSVDIVETHLAKKTLEGRDIQWLSENVGNLKITVDMKWLD